MMPNDLDRHALELSDAWDRLLTGDPAAAQADDDLLATVHQLAALAPERSMSPELEQSIWTNVIAGTSDLWRPEPASIVDAAAVTESQPHFGQLSAWIMRFAWLVIAGFAGGFIAGIGSRIAMRVAGVLTDDFHRFMLTDNGNRVGEMTLEGTLFLGVLAGAVGIITIMLYAVLRNLLPFSGWRRSMAFGVLLLLVFGYVLMDPASADYNRFGPAWLNIATFSLVYLLMGFCTSQTYEWGLRRGFPLRVGAVRSPLRFPVIGIAVVVGAVGIAIALSAMVIGERGLIVVALGLVAWLINRLALRDRLASLPAPALVQAWGLLVVPGILGFILTARGITEILMNR